MCTTFRYGDRTYLMEMSSLSLIDYIWKITSAICTNQGLGQKQLCLRCPTIRLWYPKPKRGKINDCNRRNRCLKTLRMVKLNMPFSNSSWLQTDTLERGKTEEIGIVFLEHIPGLQLFSPQGLTGLEFSELLQWNLFHIWPSLGNMCPFC